LCLIFAVISAKHMTSSMSNSPHVFSHFILMRLILYPIIERRKNWGPETSIHISRPPSQWEWKPVLEPKAGTLVGAQLCYLLPYVHLWLWSLGVNHSWVKPNQNGSWSSLDSFGVSSTTTILSPGGNLLYAFVLSYDVVSIESLGLELDCLPGKNLDSSTSCLCGFEQVTKLFLCVKGKW
jgi:hypothetical protein